MNKKYILGIDTSNYTTSFAIITSDGELVTNLKFPLPVKSGECGLRQSDAVFSHIKNIPQAMKEVKNYLEGNSLIAIGVSEKPRNIEGSYMPCFLAGVSIAESIYASTDAKLFKFSHQCGHIMSALYSSNRKDLLEKPFCAFHISGGTTEMLFVEVNEFGFKAKKIGGTLDLNAGQIIDRIGVRLGLNFPCGKEMERLALAFLGKIPAKKPSVSGLSFNLSGLENMALDLFERTKDSQMVAAFVFDYIANSICKVIQNYETDYSKTSFLLAGGVMSNSIIKNKISSICDASFAEPSLSADNAVGIAVLAKRAYDMENFNGHILA